jgi:hypothetical protein
MNLPMTPNALSIPISVSTAIDMSAVPIHKRRVEGRPRLIQASVPQRMPSVKNQVSLKTDLSFERWNVRQWSSSAAVSATVNCKNSKTESDPLTSAYALSTSSTKACR